MGHQVSAPLPVAVWTEALTGAVNQSGAVWEMSPVGTVIETQVVRWMCELAGFDGGGGRDVHVGRHRGDLRRAARGAPGGHPRRLDQRRRRRTRRSSSAASTRTTACRARSASSASAPSRAVVVPSRDFRMDVDALVAGAGPPRARGPDGHGRRRDRRHDRDRVVRRPRGDRAAVRGARHLAARGRRPRGLGAAVGDPPPPPRRHPPRPLDRLGPAQDDADAAHRERRPRQETRPTSRRRSASARRTCSTRRDGRRAGTRACAASRARAASTRSRSGSRSSATAPTGLAALYDHLCANAARAARRRRLAARLRGAARAASRTSSASATSATARLDDERLDAINLQAREEYNRAGTGWITTTMLGGRRVLRTTLMNPRTTVRDLEATLEDLAQIASAHLRERRPPVAGAPVAAHARQCRTKHPHSVEFDEAFGVDRVPQGQVRTCGAWFCIRPTALLARSRRRAPRRLSAGVGGDGRHASRDSLGRGRTGGAGRRERSRRRGGEAENQRAGARVRLG